jgi:hypothetical protein
MNFLAYKSKSFSKAINVVLPQNKSIILVAIQTNKEWNVYIELNPISKYCLGDKHCSLYKVSFINIFLSCFLRK